jgi:CRISPR system Cascade subunit CasE
MMFISHLMVNTGDNPDRPRPGRVWLRNIYHVHQRLSMAFPSRELKVRDPEFLRPYDPESFERPKFLFRIDHDVSRTVILVQSELMPDWDYAFQNAWPLLSAPPQAKEIAPRFSHGDSFRFRLFANPTLKKSVRSLGKKNSPRVGLMKREDQIEWFKRRAKLNGFECDWDSVSIESQGLTAGWKARRPEQDDSDIRLFGAQFDGLLKVDDVDHFENAVLTGVGPSKAFGFGLLSIAPLTPASS